MTDWAVVVLALGTGIIVGAACVGMVWVSNAASRIQARAVVEMMAEEEETVDWTPDNEL